MESNLGVLPADVLLEIFSYCSYTDLLNFRFVCRWWQQVIRQKHLWRHVMYKPNLMDTTKEIIDNLKASPELGALDLRYVKESTVTKELIEQVVNGCPGLEQLTVFWNFLYQNIHSVMKKIKVLILDHNEVLCGSLISFEYLLTHFPNVEYLDCSTHYFIEGDLKAYLEKKGHSLHSIVIRCQTHNNSCTLSHLSVCTNLKKMTLSDVCDHIGNLPIQSVEYLKAISSLTVRDSGWNNLIDYFPMFKYFPNLVELQFDECDVWDVHPLLEVTKNCPLLEKLTLSSLAFKNYNLKYIAHFKKLTFLCLRNMNLITDSCVAHLRAIVELRHLDISGCERLTPECLLDLCSFPKLQTLKFDLKNCHPPANLCANHMTNPSLHVMFYNCKNNSVPDYLKSQQLRISVLLGYSLWD